MKTSRGYSLLEVMISMVILAIAFLALIASQYGALNGYVAARDAQQAAELGRRTSELLRIQGSQWIKNVVYTNVLGNSVDTFQPVDLFAAGPMPFDRVNPIEEIRTAPGNTWIPLVDTPVDGRFNRVNLSISTNHLGGKYCIYARGADFGGQFAALNGTPVVAAMRFQIAVVYPGPRATLVNCAVITAANLDDVGDPNAVPFVPPPLEGLGMRVAYFGTVVVRRAHLTQFAGGLP